MRTRAETGDTCPLEYLGRKKPHVWLETTLPGDAAKSFGCDYCSARAVEQRRVA